VLAELPPAPATLPWEWLSLEPTSKGKGEYTFEMDGRFPVARADVASTDNSLVQWTLFSRDDESAEWQRRSAPWIAYQVQQGTQGQRQQSAAQPLGGVHRDRYWKLVANPAETATAPTLRLGYQPEVLVFLSQGAAPYALAVGSATARRTDAPIGVLIEELRQRNDPSWQPTLARLEGSPEPLAGDAALKPQHDWKSWLLWALLGWACWWWAAWRSACFGRSRRLRRRFRRTWVAASAIPGPSGWAGDAVKSMARIPLPSPPARPLTVSVCVHPRKEKEEQSCLAGRSCRAEPTLGCSPGCIARDTRNRGHPLRLMNLWWALDARQASRDGLRRPRQPTAPATHSITRRQRFGCCSCCCASACRRHRPPPPAPDTMAVCRSPASRP
jgi:hypothetical protein